MLTTLLPPTAGTARVAGFDVVHQGPQVRASIGAALQEAALDPLLTGREHLRLQASLQGLPRELRKPRADELLDARRADRGRRPQGARLLGRHEAPARPRARARPLAADPLPRRADDRPRHPEPDRALGGGRAARARRGRDRLPHDAVPRGGRRARRPGRDHRPRPHRRRGHAGRAQGDVGRPTVEAVPADPAERERVGRDPGSLRRAVRLGARRRRPAPLRRGRPRRDRPRARRRAPQGRAPPAAPALARRRLPRQDRPLARGRRRRGGARSHAAAGSRWNRP